VLDAIEAYESDIRARNHPRLPSASCTPTLVRGGVEEFAVPDYCDLTVDRRLLPGETVDGELESLKGRLRSIVDTDPEFDFEISALPYRFEPAEIDPGSSRLVNSALGALHAVTGRPGELYGTPYASDVSTLIIEGGMEAITFGPGNVAESHCADERVSLHELRDAARVTAKIAVELLVA
jgi:acetylornithine deacetylase/succinyl-diaminopimelate desuccinylase-like protein